MNKLKVILAGPGDNVEGGIPAVIKGIIKCFDIKKDEIEYERIIQGKAYRNMSKFERIKSEFSQVFNFISTLKRIKPDIIHIQTSFDKKTVIRDNIYLRISKLFKVKFILHVHGGHWDSLTNANKLFSKFANFFLSKCDFIIVTSIEEFNFIKENFPDIKNVALLNNVVEVNLINRNEEVIKDKKKIIFASRLIETKGVLDLIEAINHIRNRKDFILDIYGTGPLENEIVKIINEKKLDSFISYKKEISFDNLLKEYQNGDIFVFPSYHHEGFPMAFFYAVACGISIVTSKVRPIPNFMENIKNCIYIEEKNIESIKNGIVKLLDDDMLRKEMSINNIELVKIFNSNLISNQLFDIYKKAKND